MNANKIHTKSVSGSEHERVLKLEIGGPKEENPLWLVMNNGMKFELCNGTMRYGMAYGLPIARYRGDLVLKGTEVSMHSLKISIETRTVKTVRRIRECGDVVEKIYGTKTVKRKTYSVGAELGKVIVPKGAINENTRSIVLKWLMVCNDGLKEYVRVCENEYRVVHN